MEFLGEQYRTGKLDPAIVEVAKEDDIKMYASFMAAVFISMTYYMTFKTYHKGLVKMDQLNTIFNNPNARVAVGK